MSKVIPMTIDDEDFLVRVIDRLGGLSRLLLLFADHQDMDVEGDDHLALVALYYGIQDEADKLTTHIAERRIGRVTPISTLEVVKSASGQTGGDHV